MTSQFNRTAVYVSLGLALAMVAAVLGGAKFYFNTVAKQPVAVTELPSAQADSPECAAVIAAVPDKLYGHSRSELVEPAPAGVAAWATISAEATVLRCGVDLPAQYTQYSQTTDVNGSAWLEVKDMTPSSDLTTWYNTDHFPTVAVTTHDDGAPEEITGVLDGLEAQTQQPAPSPLSQLEPAANIEAVASQCRALIDAAPDSLADAYTRLPADALRDAGTPADSYTAVWTAAGREAVELRCGVAPPPGYQAGEQLEQIDEVPWFEDTTLASGTTASTWFALGRSTDIALSVPQDVAGEVLQTLTAQILATTQEQ